MITGLLIALLVFFLVYKKTEREKRKANQARVEYEAKMSRINRANRQREIRQKLGYYDD